MPDLTPALPSRYRRSALAVLRRLVARAAGDVAEHAAAVRVLGAGGERAADAQASLGLARGRLALLRGRERFLRSGKPS